MVRYTQVVRTKPGSVQAPRRRPVMLTKPKPIAYARAAKALSVEKKFFDTSLVNTSDASGGIVLNSLNLVPQGIKF